MNESLFESFKRVKAADTIISIDTAKDDYEITITDLYDNLKPKPKPRFRFYKDQQE